jgi:hypothetical protein
MGIFGTILGAAGSLLGIGGNKQKADPYGPQAATTVNAMKARQGAYDPIRQQGAATLSQFGGQGNAATQEYVNALRANPFTDARRGMELTRITEGTDNAYLLGKANLLRQMKARGLTGSGLAAAGASQLERARAGSISDAYRQLAQRDEEERLRNLGEAAGATNRQAALGQSSLLSALGAQGGIDSDVLNYLLGQSGRVAQENEGRRNASAGAIGSLASLAGLF